jgi:hypothetical protein
MQPRMEVYSVQQIKYEFLLYMKGLGGPFSDWYVGASSDPLQSIAETPSAEGDARPWMYKPALSARATQTIVRYFRETLGTNGPDSDAIPEGATYAYLVRMRAGTPPTHGAAQEAGDGDR